MAARVALLLAFTGIFATAWESDRSPVTTMLAAKPRLPERPPLIQEARRDPIISQISRGIAISSESNFSRCVIPDGILPGTYRVNDERGSVGWTTIHSGDGSQEDASRADKGSQKTADLFVSQSPKGRWYFIRIEAAPSLATPQVDHPVLR